MSKNAEDNEPRNTQILNRVRHYFVISSQTSKSRPGRLRYCLETKWSMVDLVEFDHGPGALDQLGVILILFPGPRFVGKQR